MNKLINLLERTLNSRSKKLTKKDEYMFFSPFVSHYKPKLQINMESQKWHCWVSNVGGRNFFQLFKKIGATREQFNELVELVGEPKFYKKNKEVNWLMKSDYRSPCYTTNWCDIPKVKV